MQNLKIKNIIKDIVIHNKLRSIIINNICPNFIYYYYSNVLISNILLLDDNKSSEKLYLTMEYCDGTLVDYLKTIYDIEHYESLFFQICVSVLCMQKCLKLLHNDLHSYNILFKKINKDTIFNYNINDINYYIPSFGFLFVIIDFERSILLDNIKESKYKKEIEDKINKNYDFNNLKKLYHRPVKIILKNKNIDNMQDLLKLIQNQDHKTDIFNFNKDNKDDKTLFSSTLHFILDNNYLDLSNFIDKETSNVITILKELTNNIFLSEKPIEELLNIYFKKYQKKILSNNSLSKSFNIHF